MQVLFIYNKPVILVRPDDHISEDLTTYTFIEHPKDAEIPAQLDRLKEDVEAFCIITTKPDEILETLLKNFQHWTAAGGLVTNPAGEILLLFRKGKWDLPKGKSEPEETPEETALREVTEETGLQNIQIVRKLTETWHSYPVSVYESGTQENTYPHAKDILKQTSWYQMEFTGNELTIPQIEEDIMDIQWIKPENIHKYLKFSYPNLKLVFQAAGYL